MSTLRFRQTDERYQSDAADCVEHREISGEKFRLDQRECLSWNASKHGQGWNENGIFLKNNSGETLRLGSLRSEWHSVEEAIMLF